MATKLALLQKLLIDREEVIILHRGKAHCSCGVGIEDFSDIENHLVHAHDKLSSDSSRKCLQVVLKDIINRLPSNHEHVTNLSEQQLDIEIPLKTFAVCLDENLIVGGGKIRETLCNICSASCYSFKTLKDHYLRQHPGSWASAATCRSVDRILFTKPSKECLKSRQGLLDFQYYCPLPGCKYHVGQHQKNCRDVKRSFSSAEAVKSFPSYSLLKQHYSKMHAHRSHICERCESGFATDVYLRRHKKLTCGKSWTCPSPCKATFSAREGLQTHCRRKGHQLSLNSCKKSPPPPQPSKLKVPPLMAVACKQEKSDSTVSSSSSKYVKIAPMPSLTMTAAIALSELSSKEPLVVSSPGSFFTTSKNQQQQQHTLMAGRRDKLLWSAASTQTSPRGEDQAVSASDHAPVAEISEESILKAAAAASVVRTNGIPKLGEIEQYSTETQTDDLELLLKPAASTGIGCGTSDGGSNGQNEDEAFTIEAQTQFDLDDILCSNYTQTALFDTSLDPNSGSVMSAETQTMLMSYDHLVNMETQTMLDF